MKPGSFHRALFHGRWTITIMLVLCFSDADGYALGRASLTQLNPMMRRAESFCGYRFCDPHYNCQTDGNSSYLCRIICHLMKFFENCNQDPCASSPCMNAGVCSSQGYNNFTCECQDGFYGNTCQFVAPPNDVLLVRTNASIELWNISSGAHTIVYRSDARLTASEVDWTIRAVFFSKGIYTSRGVYNLDLRIFRADLVENSAVTVVTLLPTDVTIIDIDLDIENQIIYYLINGIEIRRVAYDGSAIEPTLVHACEGGRWIIDPPVIYPCPTGAINVMGFDTTDKWLYFHSEYGTLMACDMYGSGGCGEVRQLSMSVTDISVDITGKVRPLFLVGYGPDESYAVIQSFNPDNNVLTELVRNKGGLDDFFSNGITTRNDILYYYECNFRLTKCAIRSMVVTVESSTFGLNENEDEFGFTDLDVSTDKATDEPEEELADRYVLDIDK